MKKFELISCTPSTTANNDNVCNIIYNFIDEWNDKQVCSADCYLRTDASSGNKFLRTAVFRVKDENGKWNERLAKNLICTDIYHKNELKHIHFLKRTLIKAGLIK